MATVADQPGVDEEKKKQEGLGTGAPIGGTGAPSAGGGGSGVTGQRSTSPTSSGSYTDVGKYITANNPSIDKFARQATSGLAEKMATAKTNADNQASEIQSKIDSNTLAAPGEDYTVEEARNVLTGGGFVLPKKENVTIEAKQDAGIYANQADIAGGSQGGARAFLGDQLSDKVRDYSSGERSLDAMFLRGSGAGRQALRDIATTGRQTVNDITAQEQGLRDTIDATTTANQEVSDTFGDSLRDDLTDLTKGGGVPSGRRNELLGSTGSELDDIIEKMRTDGTYEYWSPEQQEFYQKYGHDAIIENDGANQAGFGGIGGGLSGGTGQNMAQALYDMYKASGKNDLLGGMTMEQQAQAQALRDMTEGIAGYEDVYGGSNTFSQNGIYDAGASQQSLIDFWNNLGNNQTAAAPVPDPVAPVAAAPTEPLPAEDPVTGQTWT